ncbi:NADH dehydrogenase [ubiquinone] flavoprotein 3, mitochondrial isoform X1 [Oxyura jamaicensis]|uniref:NADH dehydrogenase [ubiquinone] flavoprotein 3, mitochondrial isoform X1 n=1 Tax=Oxyura jamaicensis TaxID=8884 RepID=UPI0015A53C45|nr:NADH dehydrogenase [ubiquinone] flavoprotein 3, mitochondrial isoform X1 [Oxyura jamaicensis]
MAATRGRARGDDALPGGQRAHHKMAAPSLLRCGRAAARQALRLDPPTPRCAPSSAALCTRPAGSGTPADSNVMTPQGSTKLLATKATVEFPKTLSSSSVSPNEGETISSTNLKEASKPSDEDLRALMSRKTVVAFPQRVIVSSIEEEKPTTAATGGGIRKELAEEEESSSSSSSDSDSSSDSEEENDDDDSEVAIKTRVEFPRRDSKLTEKVTIDASKLPKGNLSQKRHKESVAKKKPSKSEPDASTIEQVTFSKTPVGHKTSKSKARNPNIKSAPEETDQQKLALEPHLDENRALTDTTLKSDYLKEKATGTQMATTQLKAPSVAQEDKKQSLVSGGEAKRVKEAQESEAIEVTPEQEEETFESTVLVMGTKEETVQEAGDQAGESSTIEEPAAAAQPDPEEFDNSTYKNLQHHEYNIYTFVDSVVVLSKFRQPQPSSGRPSPRH